MQAWFAGAALYDAASKGAEERVRTLIGRFPEAVRYQTAESVTALFAAAQVGHQACVQLLPLSP